MTAELCARPAEIQPQPPNPAEALTSAALADRRWLKRGRTQTACQSHTTTRHTGPDPAASVPARGGAAKTLATQNRRKGEQGTVEELEGRTPCGPFAEEEGRTEPYPVPDVTKTARVSFSLLPPPLPSACVACATRERGERKERERRETDRQTDRSSPKDSCEI